MEVSSRARKALLTALGVLIALTVVAIAARGSISTGEGGTRRPSQALIDILFTLYLLMIASSAVLVVYLLVLRRQIAAQGGLARRRTPLESLLTAIVLIGATSLLARRIADHNPLAPPEAPQLSVQDETAVQTTPDGVVYEPEFAWPAAVVTVVLIVLALGAWWYGGRARKRARGELESRDDRLATELAAAMDESLWDLRAEPDPRRAVIKAYARLERVLAAHRLPRRPAEAPLEYLARMLDDLAVSPEAARRLTNLFERAKFSQHAVPAEMKEEAISALETVRDDLLAARALAEEEYKAALAARRERTA